MVHMWWVPLAIVLLLLAILIEHFLRNRRFYQLGKRLPGPKPWPIVGNALEFIGVDTSDLEFLTNKVSNYRDICGYWLGPRLYVLINSPGMAQTCYKSRDLQDRSEEARFLKAATGRGLTAAEGEEWNKAKKLVVPAMFQTSHLKNLIPVFNKHADAVIRLLELEIDKPAFDVHPYMKNCTFCSAWETTVEQDTMFQEEGAKEVLAYNRFTELIFARIFKFWQRIDFIYKFTSEGREHDATVKSMQSFVGKSIQAKIKNFESKTVELGDLKRCTLIDRLLEGGQCSFEELRDHAIATIVAAYDTSSVSISFVLVMLALHPDIQEKVFEEIMQVRNSGKNNVLDLDDMKGLEYLDMVIKETLRLFPAVPLSDRRVAKDLDLGSYVVPRGATLAVNIYTIHRDPISYERPEKFDPDNFLPEKVAKRHPYAFIPFGGGLRGCVGAKYAMLSMKVMISRILCSYKLHCDYRMEDLKLKVNVTMHVGNGFNIRITKRKE